MRFGARGRRSFAFTDKLGERLKNACPFLFMRLAERNKVINPRDVTKRLHWILILSGSCLLIYNLLSFFSEKEGCTYLRLLDKYVCTSHDGTKFFVTLGIALLVFGILVMRDKSKS